MTKSKSLLAAIAARPEDSATRPVNYLERLKQRDPELYTQLLEVMDSFIAGGTVFTRFPTINKLHQYLTDEGVISISHSQFRAWISDRKRASE